MNWFINLTTRAKLFLSIGIGVVLLITVIFVANRGITSVERSQDRIYSVEFANVSDLMALKVNQSDTRLALLMMMSLQDRGSKEMWHQKIKTTVDNIEKAMIKLSERNRQNARFMQKLDDLNSTRLAYKQTRDTTLIPLIYDGKTDDARKIALGIQAERYEKMELIATDLIKEAENNASVAVTESKTNARQAVNIFTYVGIITIFLGIGLAFFLNNILSGPLTVLAGVADRIGSGDLTVNAGMENRHDEVGRLAHTFNKMLTGLRTQTRDVLEAVNVLASSSTQIAATTTQLAAGTEETAVAVSQTTTTVEEVKQTAVVSSQKSKHVSDLAHNAVQVSQNGSKLVNETIDGISKIQEQMEYIAETIVRLSEHNQAIGEIIATVDDIAEQSNLLAVNASIEAAKVGEYGKGFIVVAQEIKSLAEQSKQATKQVRTILSDIQKSSSAAVMATEKGSKAVESTVKQSFGSGEAIQELSKSITEASQAVMQIAASSQQQLVGLDQIALAMTSIKQATSQNAASTKQVEATIKGLQDTGQKLKALVEHYRV